MASASAPLADTAPSRPLPAAFHADDVVARVLEVRWATRNAPPQLRPAWANLERVVGHSDEGLEYALLELIVAAMATLSRIRAAGPGRVSTGRDERVDEVLALRGEGFSNEEVAIMLGISKKAVESRLTRARARGREIPHGNCS